ncbi:RAC family serine/threonine-protein kinase like protein [Tritrichomonas foetus]|uniref:RAC family serine/threonine-protein kinase like protein n=1 Tax=Tritrichomonas foetus TaxID=1144522 RepID=A0A1J4J9V3_9EUKA|nr:RAC family serine/threonine-protein kinase like protein [Tritrichomonas foetus]|eukprot:OHS94999.1 RAC family serine/threonine-protein kinase like protein [Tritrichomonas foetus]
MELDKPDYLSGFIQRQNVLRIWVRRYAVIKGSTLIFYKDDTRQKVDLKFEITPEVSVYIEDSKELHKFIIVTKNATMVCSADSTDLLMRWVLAIRGCTFSSRKVSMQDFNIISVIGRGFYGKVMLCENKTNGEMLAIKSVQKWKLVQSKKVQNVLLERSILEICDFPFIVKMKFAFQNDKKFYLGIEYVPGGELFHHLLKSKSLPMSQVKLYVAEIALAINYLHSHNIIYRDLKPENILIDIEGHIKLTDFGLSKICDTTSTFCGTPEYLAPEIVNHQPYGKEVDWWALGALTYELIFGNTPFCPDNVYNSRNSNVNSGSNAKILFENILFRDPNFPNDTDQSIIDFINILLIKDPKKRAKFEDIKNSDFFNEIDFEKVLNKQIPPMFVPNIQNRFNPNNFDEEFTKEVPADSFNGIDVDKEDQYFAGFSYNQDPEMIENGSDRSFHPEDDDLFGRLEDTCSDPFAPNETVSTEHGDGFDLFATDLL